LQSIFENPEARVVAVADVQQDMAGAYAKEFSADLS
jgi:hypothetical protein